MKQLTKKIAKILLISAIVLGILIIILFGWLYSRFRPFNTREVRKWWSETALANSEYYHITEETARARDDAIYLRIQEMPGKLFTYRCGTPFGIRQCHLDDDLNYYLLFDKYGDKVKTLLEKHNLSSMSHALEYGQIDDVRDFAHDLLRIPDIQRLYKAFLAECERTSVEQAEEAFGWYLLCNRNSDTYPHHTNLFTWMREQGL